MSSRILTALSLLIGSAPLYAQAFNLDFGQPNATPSSSYAAAGLAGYWNGLQATGGTVYTLKDLNGQPTGVQFWQTGAAGLIAENDPSVTGDAAALMNDGLITYTFGVDSCFYYSGLQPGVYELITYAWRPNHPTEMAKSFVDNTPGVEISGGAWPGQQVHGVTYARHIVTVDSSGGMVSHSGLAQGADQSVGAVCNGIQLRPIDQHATFCFGDGSGTACPCGNSGPPGSGCANSTGNAGHLTASGGSSVSVDTVVLHASGMGATVTSLFFQGTAQDNGGAGIVVADGLGCVGGTAKRLGAKINVGGASSYPQAGDTPISIKGQIPAIGGTYYYQTWYRDPANFCTSSTFNLTNGVAVTWVP
jgi:hypothetical protein